MIEEVVINIKKGVKISIDWQSEVLPSGRTELPASSVSIT